MAESHRPGGDLFSPLSAAPPAALSHNLEWPEAWGDGSARLLPPPPPSPLVRPSSPPSFSDSLPPAPGPIKDCGGSAGRLKLGELRLPLTSVNGAPLPTLPPPAPALARLHPAFPSWISLLPPPDPPSSAGLAWLPHLGLSVSTLEPPSAAPPQPPAGTHAAAPLDWTGLVPLAPRPPRFTLGGGRPIWVHGRRCPRAVTLPPPPRPSRASSSSLRPCRRSLRRIRSRRPSARHLGHRCVRPAVRARRHRRTPERAGRLRLRAKLLWAPCPGREAPRARVQGRPPAPSSRRATPTWSSIPTSARRSRS